MAPPAGSDVEELEIDGMAVRVIRSERRHKTSAARLVDGVVEVRVPSWLSAPDRADAVADLVARVRRSAPVAHGAVDLAERACLLARRFDLPVPVEIRWVTNQKRRWGSCSPTAGTIRISSRLQLAPLWVLDAVVVHELAHLLEPDHGPAFRELERRYPKLERAEGFLEAMGMGLALDEFTS